jgi:hypothetical protein
VVGAEGTLSEGAAVEADLLGELRLLVQRELGNDLSGHERLQPAREDAGALWRSITPYRPALVGLAQLWSCGGFASTRRAEA